MIHVYEGNIFYTTIFKIGRTIKKTISKRKKESVREDNHSFDNTKCVLYGACIIASKKHYMSEEYMFYPETFMYFEEDFLRKIIDDKQGISLYYPDIYVIHKENSTVSTIGDNIDGSNAIKLRRAVESGKKLKKYLKNN